MKKRFIFTFLLIPLNSVALENIAGEKISFGCKFQMTYTVQADGKIVDSAKSAEFGYAHNQFIKGLQNELLNKTSGYSSTISLTPEYGYGLRDESKVGVVDKTMFNNQIPLVGTSYEYSDRNGKRGVLTVTKVDGSKVTVDANHPLAGKNLIVDLTVEKVNCN